ncbi:hypothetical protein LY78DRAFT_305373 [Colletotrichum sublineola]|nr:hypothetical protein LY78DRAFT_305373 [Colletotrichum sublineola]
MTVQNGGYVSGRAISFSFVIGHLIGAETLSPATWRLSAKKALHSPEMNLGRETRNLPCFFFFFRYPDRIPIFFSFSPKGEGSRSVCTYIVRVKKKKASRRSARGVGEGRKKRGERAFVAAFVVLLGYAEWVCWGT